VFEGCFENINEGQMISLFRWSRSPSLASRPIQLLRWRTEGKLHYYSASLNFKVLACLNHLVVEVGTFISVFSSHVCSLCCYCCCWIKIGLWIDDRVLKLKFTRNRGLIRFDKEKNLINQWYFKYSCGLGIHWCRP
jgi:hypothetical protein